MIEGGEVCGWTVARESDCLSAGPASDFQDTAPRRIGGVGMQQIHHGSGLGEQTLAFDRAVAVDVTRGGVLHRFKLG
jgi:hypothetical protein